MGGRPPYRRSSYGLPHPSARKNYNDVEEVSNFPSQPFRLVGALNLCNFSFKSFSVTYSVIASAATIQVIEKG